MKLGINWYGRLYEKYSTNFVNISDRNKMINSSIISCSYLITLSKCIKTVRESDPSFLKDIYLLLLNNYWLFLLMIFLISSERNLKSFYFNNNGDSSFVRSLNFWYLIYVTFRLYRGNIWQNNTAITATLNLRISFFRYTDLDGFCFKGGELYKEGLFLMGGEPIYGEFIGS